MHWRLKMNNKRVKDNMDYIKTPNGSIILDNPNKYNEYMRGVQKNLEQKKTIANLQSEIDDLKKLVYSLLEEKRNS